MKKIDKLTPEQEALIPIVRNKWLRVGTSVGETNREEAEKCVDEIYKFAGFSCVNKKVWARSPMEAVKIMREELKIDKDIIGNYFSGSQDAYWLAYYDYFKQIGVKEAELLNPFYRLSEICGWWWPFDEVIVMSDKPIQLNLDERSRLHSTTTQSISYSDGWGIYAIHGVIVPTYVITNPEQITVEKIEKENNIEIRRVMLEKYGIQKYLIDAKADKIAEDEFGTLYRKEIIDDESIVMVKVTNATPEPDGTKKEYFLRVPPDVTTPHEAVAWTFGRTDEEYFPMKET